MSKPDGFKSVKRFRLAAGAILSGALLVPLGIFGSTGLAQSSSPAAAQYKITICHHTHSKKHPTVTIRISNKAWPAHERHHDTLGACPAPSKPAKQHGKHHAKSGKHSEHATHSQTQNSSQTQSGSPAQSGDHASEHANEHARSHGK